MILGSLIRDGWYRFPNLIAPLYCEDMAERVIEERPLNAALFLTEAEYEANPQHKGVNPRPGRNYIEWLRLRWIEDAAPIVGPLTELLGGGYTVMDRKLVCGVPTRNVPEWVKRRLANVPNLGAYVRPEYRDITYFHGIDFHQDVIDYPGRTADFLTLYVYLTPVGEADAPLMILSGSHKRGAEVFPHAVGAEPCELLTGPPGTVALWHGCMMHATRPVTGPSPRLSLRYIFARKDDRNAAIDEINAEIVGPLSLERTRMDLDARGGPI